MKMQLGQAGTALALTIPVCTLAWANPERSEKVQAIVSFFLATLVKAIPVPAFYIPAIKSLIVTWKVELDMLVVISITAAYVYSVVAFGYDMCIKPLETPELFETSTLLISLVLLGRAVVAIAHIRP